MAGEVMTGAAAGLEVGSDSPVARATRAWRDSLRSVRTRGEYTADVRAFLKWVDANDPRPLDQVDRSTVAAWVRSMDAAGHAPASVKRRLASVRSWFTALAEAGVVPASPAVGIKTLPVPPEGQTQAASDAEVRALVAACETDSERVLVELLAFHACRFSGACTVRADSVRLLPSGGVTLDVVLKGGRKTTKTLDGPAAAAVRRLVAGRAPSAISPALLEHGRLSRDARRVRWVRLAERAGVNVHPHMLRVWAATASQDMDGVTPADGAELLNHRSLASFERYDRNKGRRTSEIVGRLHDRIDGGAPSASAP